MNAENNEDVYTLGNHIFSKKAFVIVNNWLFEALNKHCKYIIVDEFGKLELKKEGIYSSIDSILKEKEKGKLKAEIIIVVRDYLFEDFLKLFSKTNLNFTVSSDFF
jgi:nucleoside-triphosphatase